MSATYSSSVEARDGSASSYGTPGENPASSRRSTSSAHHNRSRHPTNNPRGPSTATSNRTSNTTNHQFTSNAQGFEASSYSYSQSRQSTITGQSETAEPQTVDEDYTDQEYGPYYLTPRYDDEMPTYDNDLVLEEEQVDDTAPPPSYQETAMYQRQSYSVSQHTPLDNPNPDDAANETHSPTTQRWSSEYSSEERIRLGLPRQSYEHQAAYQQAHSIEHPAHRSRTE